MSTETPGPQTPCGKYVELEELRLPARDFMAGAAMLKRLDKAVVYLPRNPAESRVHVAGYGTLDRWEVRVKNARLWNKFADTVEDAVGRIFSKPIKLSNDMPKELQNFCLDVDGAGSDLDVFVSGRFEVAISEGTSFALVDFPTRPGDEPLTVAELKALKLSPFWRAYDPASVIDWEFGTWRGKRRLLYLRLKEVLSVRNATGFGFEQIVQYREFVAGNPEAPPDSPNRFVTWAIYREDPSNKGKWVVADDGKARGNMRPQVDIPFVEFPTKISAPFESDPPFADLLHMNLAHFRKLSFLDNGQMAVGFPFLYWEGAPEENQNAGQMKMAESTIQKGPQGSDLSFREVSGTAWKEVRETINQLEEQMEDSAAAHLKDDGGAVTARGESRRDAKLTSKLRRWALLGEDALANLLRYTAIYMDLVSADDDKGWGSVELNKVYVPVGAEQQKLVHREFLFNAGGLTLKTMVEEAQRDEVVSAAIDVETEIEEAAKEALARMPADLVPPGEEDPGGEPDPDEEPAEGDPAVAA